MTKMSTVLDQSAIAVDHAEATSLRSAAPTSGIGSNAIETPMSMLACARARARACGNAQIDLGVGEPRRG